MVEMNRQAAAMLDGAGINLYLPRWMKGHRIEVDLGFFPSTRKGNRALADAVRTVRLALGCRFQDGGKDVADEKKKWVQFTLIPVNYPDVRVHYCRKLPRQAKCRIVKQRSVYTTLVCEN